MTTVTFTGTDGFDFELDLAPVAAGTVTSNSASSVQIALAGGIGTVTLGGAFTGGTATTRPTGGTIDTITIVEGANSSVTQTSVSVADFFGFVDANDGAGLIAQLLAGNDTINGSAGNDTLLGLSGNDVINGGGGFDTATFALPAGTTGTLQLAEGANGKVLVNRLIGGSLAETVFEITPGIGKATVTGMGSAAAEGTDTVSTTEVLSFLIDGQSAASATLITLPIQFPPNNVPGVLGSIGDDTINLADFPGRDLVVGNFGNDTVIGTATNNFMFGGAGNDTLQGMGGNDLLNGGTGINILQGGSGDDQLVIDAPVMAGSSYDGGADNDVLRLLPSALAPIPGSTSSHVALNTATLSGIETLEFASVAGGSLMATIGSWQLPGSGLTRIQSGPGADVVNLVALPGTITLPEIDVGAGDTVVVFALNPGSYKLAPTTLVNWDAAQNALVFFANQNGSASDAYTLDAQTQTQGVVLTGAAGNDTLIGGASADVLQGKGGMNNMIGYGGNDTFVVDGPFAAGSQFVGGADTDTLQVRTMAGQAVVNSGLVPASLATTNHNFIGTTPSSLERLVFQSDAGTALTAQFTLGLRVNTANGVIDLPSQIGSGLAANAQLVGGAGFDTVTLIASTALVPTINVPLFSYDASWTTPDRGYRIGDRVLVIASGSDPVTINGSAHAGVQVLVGGGGNDTIEGSADMDMLAGGAGMNVLKGNGGNDTLLAINSYANGAPATVTTDTFAGSTFNGGAGIDFLSVGGVVDFQGSLVSIEGIHLQPGFTNTAVNTRSQANAALTISGDQWAGLPANLILDGVGTITVNLNPGQSFDTSGYVFEPGSNVQIQFVSAGNVADGYIAGAKVYVDANGNNAFDAGEPWTTTDQNGDFTLVSAVNGPIRAFGGTNVDTGLPNDLQLSAPEGSSVINPLTTLVQAIVETTGASPQAAEQDVKQALGLDPALDLTTLDLLAAAQAGDADALDAQKAAASLAKVLDTVVDAGGNVGHALDTLAQAIDDVPPGGSLDLAGSALLTDVYSDAGVQASAVAALVAETREVVQDIQSADSLDEVSDVQAQDLTLIAGGNGKDSLTGTGDNEKIAGGNGNDLLSGAGGSDRIYGENGDDELHGGEGIDLLAGGSGNDTLFGDAGNDVLAGGKGADRMAGGAGADLFAFAKGDAGGVDTITGFESGSDKLYLAAGLSLTGRSEAGGSTVLSLSDGGSIRLEGVVGLPGDPVALAASLTVAQLPLWAQSWPLA